MNTTLSSCRSIVLESKSIRTPIVPFLFFNRPQIHPSKIRLKLILSDLLHLISFPILKASKCSSEIYSPGLPSRPWLLHQVSLTSPICTGSSYWYFPVTSCMCPNCRARSCDCGGQTHIDRWQGPNMPQRRPKALRKHKYFYWTPQAPQANHGYRIDNNIQSHGGVIDVTVSPTTEPANAHLTKWSWQHPLKSIWAK